MESTEVNNCLAELREAKGWSQGELAEHLGVSRQTVNALERGKYAPSLPLAFKIARLFKRAIEDILDGTGGLNQQPRERGTALGDLLVSLDVPAFGMNLWRETQMRRLRSHGAVPH